MKLIPPNITPGPWDERDTSTASTFGKGWREIEPNVVRLACYSSSRDGEVSGVKINQANAQAIAALPQCLEALALFVYSYGCECTSGHVREGVTCPYCTAKAALLAAGYKIEA